MKKRILIKLSGEGLTSKDKKLAIDSRVVEEIAIQIQTLIERGNEVGVVIGGGNFWRGESASKNGIPRNRADYIGMLATIMNALAIQSGFQKLKIPTRVMSALNVDSRVAENYINEKAICALENGEVVIFAGGTGRPFFTTDTAGSLVASEIGAHIILMGKNGVDGVYDKDPKVHKNAKRFETLTYDDILSKGLKVMDSTAASMARDNNIQLIVFNIKEDKALVKAIDGTIKRTIIERG